MKTKNKNGKKKKIQINYDVDNTFSTSIKNGEMKIIGYVDENNFFDFVNHYLTDILDAIPTKSLGLVESYIKRRMEEKPILDNDHVDNHAVSSEGFSNDQLKYIDQFLKGYSDVSIDEMCYGKPTETVACFIFSEHRNPKNVQINIGYFDDKVDAFMFYPVVNGKFDEEGAPIVGKVLGYIPFKRNENC